jgi:hypothetical protein
MLKQEILGKTNRLTFLSLYSEYLTGEIEKNTLVCMGDEVSK